MLLALMALQRLTQKRGKQGIFTIRPYRHNGLWVFDYPPVLTREPFVAGMPEIIDTVLLDEIEAGRFPDSDPEDGFTLMFSEAPIPDEVQYCLTWLSAEAGGNHYKLEGSDLKGWLCPALSLFYKKAPKQLFVMVYY
jgi:hypothetical protein